VLSPEDTEMSRGPSFKRMGRNIIGKGGRKSFPGGRKQSLEIKGHSSSENTETQRELAEQRMRGIPALEKHSTGRIRLQELRLLGSRYRQSCGRREKGHFVLPRWFCSSHPVRVFGVWVVVLFWS